MLLREFARTRDQQLKAHLVERFLPLARSLASRYRGAGEPMEDLVQIASVGLVNAISRDVAASGVTVNALLPGYTNTDRMKEVGVTSESMGSKIPAGRIGEPHEFAALAAFLASERASYITGQAIAVDGGLLQSI